MMMNAYTDIRAHEGAMCLPHIVSCGDVMLYYVFALRDFVGKNFLFFSIFSSNFQILVYVCPFFFQ